MKKTKIEISNFTLRFVIVGTSVMGFDLLGSSESFKAGASEISETHFGIFKFTSPSTPASSAATSSPSPSSSSSTPEERLPMLHFHERM